MTNSARIDPTSGRAANSGFVRARTVSRWLLAIAYFLVGIEHIRSPHGFVSIVPGWVPFPQQTVFVTGLCELAGAAALVTKPLRAWAGIALALYAMCVWPANIKQALDHIVIPHIPDSWWYHAPRLAFQPVLIWWALFCAGVIDWPWQQEKHPPPR